MSSKVWIMSGLVIGSFLGGLVPSLWSSGGLSMTSILFNFIGGIVGVYLGFKISQSLA